MGRGYGWYRRYKGVVMGGTGDRRAWLCVVQEIRGRFMGGIGDRRAWLWEVHEIGGRSYGRYRR